MNKLWLYLGIGLTAVVIVGVVFIVQKNKTQPSKQSETGQTTAKTTNQKTTLTIWQPIDSKDDYTDIIANFESDNPNIDVKVEIKDPKTYERDVTDSLAANQGPDIWAIPNSWLARHKNKLVAAPENLFSSQKTKISNTDFIKAKFAPIVGEGVIDNNQVLGIPFFIDTLGLYVNRQIFKDVEKEINKQEQPNDNLLNLLSNGPTNWNEIIDLTKAITKTENGKITRSAIALGTAGNIAHSDDILMMFMLQNKTQITSSDQQNATFNLPQKKSTGEEFLPGKNALDFYLSFADAGKENYTWNDQMPNSQKAFLEGKVAMILDYQYLGDILRQYNPNLDFKTFALPQVYTVGKADEEPVPTDYPFYYVWAVTKASQHPSAAWKFLAAMVTNGGIDSYASATHRTRPFVYEDTPVNLDERVAVSNPFRFQIMTAKDWYRGPEPSAVSAIIKEMIETATGGDSQKALDIGSKAITDLLRE